jgi:hypothetical protein
VVVVEVVVVVVVVVVVELEKVVVCFSSCIVFIYFQSLYVSIHLYNASLYLILSTFEGI